MRALLYVRLSQEDKTGKATGIDSTRVQTQDGTKAISEMGWTLHRVVVDDDYSGTLRERPGLEVIRSAARAREMEVVAFRRLDRLSRLEAARTMALLLELHDLGVQGWDYEGRRFMSISGTEGLITYVEAMKAEGEARAASERITAGLRARALDGRAVRGAPWGYRIERTSTGPRWVIDDEQARAVRHAVETFLACGTINGTARALNDEGLVTVRGRPWISSGIRAILTRSIYRGACEHRDLTIPHPELRILSADVAEQVDRLLESVRRAPWGSTPRHLSTPFLRCALCSGSLVATSSKRSKSASLTCDKSRSRGCEGIGYRTERLVDQGLISACIGPFLDFKDNLRDVLRGALEEQRKADKRDAEVARVKRDLSKAERRQKNLTDSLAEACSATERAPVMAALRDEGKRLNALRGELGRLQASATPTSTESILDAADQRVAELLATLTAGGIQARPSVRAVLGNERLAASRGENGWVLQGSVATVHLLDAVAPGVLPASAHVFAGSDNHQKLGARHDEHAAFVGSDNEQKLKVTGATASAASTPTTTAAPVAPEAPEVPSPPPVPVPPATSSQANVAAAAPKAVTGP